MCVARTSPPSACPFQWSAARRAGYDAGAVGNDRIEEENPMAKLTAASSVVAMLAALGSTAVPAHAQLARTFVSATGSDANNCDRPTPCRTFQHAHDNTLAKGEITVLDPGGYGAVTITKAISIINDGVGEAGVLVSGGANGITVNALAGDAVSLRGLTIKGIGFGGGNGIVFTAGKSLTVENCVIRSHIGASPLGNGIVFQPSADGSFAATDTLVADNQNSGILVRPTGTGAVDAVVSRAEAYRNNNGIVIDGSQSTGTVKGALADSLVAGNAFGLVVNSTTGQAATQVVATRMAVANNGTGVAVGLAATASLRIGQSAITGNAHGWQIVTGGFLESYGDNMVDGNTADEGPMSPISTK
jgi:hypothetical protein